MVGKIYVSHVPFGHRMRMSATCSRAARWGVIGAGPCGVAAVGVLRDSGFSVTWVDNAEFACGRMALGFDESQAIRRKHQHEKRILADLDPHGYSKLGVFLDALEDSVDKLKGVVDTFYGTAVALDHCGDRDLSPWKILINNDTAGITEVSVDVDAVILCTGSQPIVPHFVWGQSVSADDAIDPSRLALLLSDNPVMLEKTWVVVGNSHSGILALKNLVEAGVKRIINIYRSEIQYFSDTNGFIRFQGSGLKGPVAKWCKQYVKCCEEGIEKKYRWIDRSDTTDVEFIRADPYLPLQQQLQHIGADYTVCTIGFQREVMRTNGKVRSGCPPVTVAGKLVDTSVYDESNGRIAGVTGLYGAGIAYPQVYINSDGLREQWVGFGFGLRNVRAIVDSWRKDKDAATPESMFNDGHIINNRTDDARPTVRNHNCQSE